MRLTRSGLLRYGNLQQTWPPTAILHRARVAPPACQTSGRRFATGKLRRETHFVESFFSTRSRGDTSSSESPGETEHDILVRARAYNIQTEHQLAFESDVINDPNSRTFLRGIRLVDREPYKDDFYLWTILLDWRRLKFGDKGIRMIWEGLKCRSRLEDLPVIGYQGDRLWSAFVAAGIRNTKFLVEVVRQELRKGSQRPGFFLEVVGTLLSASNPSSAKSFARMLQIKHQPNKDELFELFVRASVAENPKALQLYCDIYATMPPIGLYGQVIAYLCAQERCSDAWTLHRYLLARDDLPQVFEDVRPLVIDLVNSHMRLESFLHELTKAGVSMNAQAKTFYAQERSLRLGFPSENLSIVSSGTLGVQPRALSDTFVARAFLTATFSFDSILGGLRFFGLKTVGPSSVRAMGLSAANSQDLMTRFDKLADVEVDTLSSRFSRVVRRLAEQGQERILQDVLRSDMHADAFEDVGLQRRLLSKCYCEADWPGVNRTLAILTVGCSDDVVKETVANLVLQAALSARNWFHVRRLVAEMSKDSHRFHEISISQMRNTILSERNPGNRPHDGKQFDDLGFLISIWLKVLRSGTMISVTRWREPIRRLGMSGRLDELEALLIRLLHWYGDERGSPSILNVHSEPQRFDELLSPALQSAIVEWGFINTRDLKPSLSGDSNSTPSRRYPWTRGILFLRRLGLQYHCRVNETVVRRACLLRLRQLFHPQTESVLVRNRRSFLRNKVPFWVYISSLEAAWTEPLFVDKQKLWKDVNEVPVGLRQRRRVRLRRQLSKHTSRLNALSGAASSNGLENHRPGTVWESIPSDVVIYGGPLSQGYWSSR